MRTQEALGSSRRTLLSALAALGMTALCSHGIAEEKGAGRLVVVDAGRSAFTIVVADDASPSTRYGAAELQRFLKQMTGVQLPIRSDKGPVAGHEIILGDNAHLRQLGVAIDFDRLGHEGYVIRTVAPHLVIAGGQLRGNLYGVYGLLEDHLGCRWFTPTVSRIPKRERLAIAALNETRRPPLEYREPFVMDCFDGDWCARNRVNSSAGRLEARHGGKVRFGRGMFVHTFNRLIPPDKYFDAHPEYFSQIDGKRVKDHTQLCCTNEEVVKICTDEMRKHMRADPEARVFSLSQNDWINYCECPKCRALVEREGSQMGPVLYLVNRVAEALEKGFPDKAIETLAYQYTRKPPKTMRPRRNVIIRLCSIECCFMHPLATCDQDVNRAFVRDLEGWAKVANRLWVWDYVTSFADYLVPFPNLRVRDDNIRLLVKNNVTGIFEQDVYNTLNGELSALSGYLGAKLLWDPGYDEDRAINEFLEGVYGKAAGPIRKTIDLMHDAVEDQNIHAGIWVDSRAAPYLTDALLAKCSDLWDEAEKMAANDPGVLERVRFARLSVDHAILDRQRGPGGTGQFVVDHRRFQARTRPEYGQRLDRFFQAARRAGVTRLRESRLDLDQYEADTRREASGEVLTFAPLDAVRLADAAPGIGYAYYEGTWQQLPDFDALKPVSRGTIDRIDLSKAKRDQFFALRFRGYVSVPRDGVYTFFVSSNDGSQLLIGWKLVVDNDGLHSATKVGGFVGLKAGLHPIDVRYFQEGGTTQFAVTYDGPGISERTIEPSKLLHRKGQ